MLNKGKMVNVHHLICKWKITYTLCTAAYRCLSRE